MLPTRPLVSARFSALVSLVLIGLLVSGCGGGDEDAQAPVSRMQGDAFGTFFQITLAGEHDPETMGKIREGVQEVLDSVDAQMSTYRDDSDLNQLNDTAIEEWASVPAELFYVLDRSQAIARETEGAFDVTVGGLVNLWSFGPESRPMETPSDDELQERLAAVGHDQLELDAEQQRARRQSDFFVDLSGIAKGYAVDRVAEHLASQGHEDFLVNIGGDMVARGKRGPDTQWRIGIEIPQDGPAAAHQVVPLSNMSLATSGDYRNYFEEDGQRYSHTIDPRTGRPIDHTLVSVSVFHPDNTTADAYATAFMVMGSDETLAFAEEHDIALLVIDAQEDEFRSRVSSEYERLLGENSVPDDT